MAVVDATVRDVLGESVTYSPTIGTPLELKGVFDAVYIRVDAGQPGISSQGPAVFLLTTDLPAGAADDLTATITVDAIEYVISEIKPDGMASLVFMLHRA